MTKCIRTGGIASAILFAFVHFTLVACGNDSSSSPTTDLSSEVDGKNSVSSSSEVGLSSSSIGTESSSQGKNSSYGDSSASEESSSSETPLPSGHFAWQFLNPNLSYGEVEHDSIIYKTIEINGLTWFAENVTTKGSLQATSLNDNNYKYGFARYLGDDLCPPDWHVPSSDEFMTLEDAGDLRGGDEWLCGEVSNESGFTALPGGEYNYRGYRYDDQGVEAAFYTMDSHEEWDKSNGGYFDVYNCAAIDTSGKVRIHLCTYWANQYHVRCVKNPEGFDYYAVSTNKEKNVFVCDESNADKTLYQAIRMKKYVCRQNSESEEWDWEIIVEDVPEEISDDDSEERETNDDH